MAVKLFVSAKEKSWSSVTNKSDVVVSVTAQWTYGSYNLNEPGGTLTIDGVDYPFISNFNEKRTTSGSQVLFSKDVTIEHDDLGKKRLYFSAVFATGVSSGTISASDYLDLTNIPRASTALATDANIGAVSMIAVDRKAAKFTHSIAWKFGSLSGYLKADGSNSTTEVKLSILSVPFLIPDAFYAQIPKAKTGKCTLTVKTYDGTSQVGTIQTTTFTVTAPEAECRPIVSGTVVDINDATVELTGDDSVMVRYCSEASCEITAEARKSATVSEKKIGGTVVTGNSRTISGIAASSVEFYVKDSRGYTATAKVGFTLIPYVRLTNNAVASRVDPGTGVSVLTLSGNYFNGSFGAYQNALQIQYSVDGGDPVEVAATVKGNKYSATVEIPNLDYLTSHIVDVVVSDLLDSVPKEVKIGRSVPGFYWDDENFFMILNFVAPNFLKTGVAKITPSAANTPTYVDVVFDAPFPGMPAVTLGAYTMAPGTEVKGCGVSAVTKNGFRIYLTRSNTVETWVFWQAVYDPGIRVDIEDLQAYSGQGGNAN